MHKKNFRCANIITWMYTGFNGIFDVVNRTINVKKGIEHMFCAERDREREAMVYFILSNNVTLWTLSAAQTIKILQQFIEKLMLLFIHHIRIFMCVWVCVYYFELDK